MSAFFILVVLRQISYLVGDTDDTASRAGTSVTSLLGLLVSALAEVVGAGVDNDGALRDFSVLTEKDWRQICLRQ